MNGRWRAVDPTGLGDVAADVAAGLQVLCDRLADLQRLEGVAAGFSELVAYVDQARIRHPLRTAEQFDLLIASLHAVPVQQAAHRARTRLGHLATTLRTAGRSDPIPEVAALAACLHPPQPGAYAIALRAVQTVSHLLEQARQHRWIDEDVHLHPCEQLREYRNLIHPLRQVQMGEPPDRDTVDLCWPVVNAVLNDLAATRPTDTPRPSPRPPGRTPRSPGH